MMWCKEQYIPKFMDTMYSEKIKDLVRRDELIDMFHTNQMISKYEIMKAISTFDISNLNVLYIGSWMGYLTHFLCNDFNCKVFEIDLDPRCKPVSEKFNSENKNYMGHLTVDANQCNKDFYSDFDVVINLSTEHMSDDWFKKLNTGTKVAIQCNNFDSLEDHNHCVYCLKELKQRFKLSNTLFESTLKCTVYDRYTLVGII